MKSAIILFSCFFLLIIFFSILLGSIRSIQIKHKPEQKEFLSGKVPSKMPDGFYKGTVKGLKVPWLGKKFDSAQMSGINVFKEQNKTTENYPFTLSVGKGIQDKDLTVLKIDYSDNKHPWWLRYILDEVVEIAPGKLLGKVHIMLIPGLPCTIGYFELKK